MNNKQIITFVNSAYVARLGLAAAEQCCISSKILNQLSKMQLLKK